MSDEHTKKIIARILTCLFHGNWWKVYISACLIFLLWTFETLFCYQQWASHEAFIFKYEADSVALFRCTKICTIFEFFFGQEERSQMFEQLQLLNSLIYWQKVDLLIHQRITLLGHEAQTLCCWKSRTCWLVATQITNQQIYIYCF